MKHAARPTAVCNPLTFPSFSAIKCTIFSVSAPKIFKSTLFICSRFICNAFTLHSRPFLSNGGPDLPGLRTERLRAPAALALNCMLQPCGSVCGFPPRLRTYLRSSPFVCAADSVATIIRFGVYLLHGVSPTRAARAIFALRFQNLDISELDGLQALEQQAWLRILAFVISLLSQTIKIFACGGIPWTRSAAAAYL